VCLFIKTSYFMGCMFLLQFMEKFDEVKTMSLQSSLGEKSNNVEPASSPRTASHISRQVSCTIKNHYGGKHIELSHIKLTLVVRSLIGYFIIIMS